VANFDLNEARTEARFCATLPGFGSNLEMLTKELA
jgi:hypothetical protein